MNPTDLTERNTIRDSLEDVVTNGRQLMVNQLALIGAEAREGLDSAVNRIIEAIIAILLGFLGFIILTLAGMHLLEEYLGRPSAYGIVGGCYVIVAVILARLSAGKRPLTGKDD